MKKIIISLILLCNTYSYASDDLPADKKVLFSYCPTVLAAVHTDCFMTKRYSQKCVLGKRFLNRSVVSDDNKAELVLNITTSSAILLNMV